MEDQIRANDIKLLDLEIQHNCWKMQDIILKADNNEYFTNEGVVKLIPIMTFETLFLEKVISGNEIRDIKTLEALQIGLATMDTFNQVIDSLNQSSRVDSSREQFLQASKLKELITLARHFIPKFC